MAAQASGEEAALQRAKSEGMQVLHCTEKWKQLLKRKKLEYSNHGKAGTWNQDSRAGPHFFNLFFPFLLLIAEAPSCHISCFWIHCVLPVRLFPALPIALLSPLQDHRPRACPRHKQDSHVPHSHPSTSTLPRRRAVHTHSTFTVGLYSSS